MSTLLLREADVEALLTMRMAMDAVEGALRALAADNAMNVPRTRAQAPGVVLHSMSASAAYLGLVGWKNYVTTRQGAQFHVGLYEQTSGRLVVLIEADYLGQLRTGAVTGVAAGWLALHEATEVGIFGTGKQARTQLRALAEIRPLKRAFVYSRNPGKREQFAEEMTAALGFEVLPVDRPQEAVEDLPIVVTATTSSEPVFDGHNLSQGTLVCAVGSNWLSKAEIDSTVVRRADHIVCDSVTACRNEAGDFVDAREKGIFDWSRPVDLSDVIAGRAVGRSLPENIVLFKSVGLAIEDVALGAKLLDLARAKGVGTELPL